MGGLDKGISKRQRAFAERVRQRRLRLGLSQEALAHAASLNRTYMTTLEAGLRNPSLETMAKIAAALDCDLGDLTSGLQSIPGRS